MRHASTEIAILVVGATSHCHRCSIKSKVREKCSSLLLISLVPYCRSAHIKPLCKLVSEGPSSQGSWRLSPFSFSITMLCNIIHVISTCAMSLVCQFLQSWWFFPNAIARRQRLVLYPFYTPLEQAQSRKTFCSSGSGFVFTKQLQFGYILFVSK